MADTYNELIRTVLVPFRLSLQVSSTGATATLSWDAVIGKQYQVQFKNDLAAAWTNFGASVTATNLSMSATDNSGSGPQHFYRVLVTAQRADRVLPGPSENSWASASNCFCASVNRPKKYSS